MLEGGNIPSLIFDVEADALSNEVPATDMETNPESSSACICVSSIFAASTSLIRPSSSSSESPIPSSSESSHDSPA